VGQEVGLCVGESVGAGVGGEGAGSGVGEGVHGLRMHLLALHVSVEGADTTAARSGALACSPLAKFAMLCVRMISGGFCWGKVGGVGDGVGS